MPALLALGTPAPAVAAAWPPGPQSTKRRPATRPLTALVKTSNDSSGVTRNSAGNSPAFPGCEGASSGKRRARPAAVPHLPGQLPVHLLQRVHVFLLDPQDRLVAPEQHHPAVLAFYLVDVGIRLPHRPLIVSVNHPVGRHASAPLCRIATVHPTSGLSRKLCKPGWEPPVATGPAAGRAGRSRLAVRRRRMARAGWLPWPDGGQFPGQGR